MPRGCTTVSCRTTTPSLQLGEAYNDAYAKDYGQYQDYLGRLDTLHGYYTAQEQAEISQRQQVVQQCHDGAGRHGGRGAAGLPAPPAWARWRAA